MNYKQNATPCVSRILGDVCAQWEYPDAERAIGIAPAQNEPLHFHLSAMQGKRPVKSSTQSSYKHDDGYLLTIGVH